MLIWACGLWQTAVEIAPQARLEFSARGEPEAKKMHRQGLHNELEFHLTPAAVVAKTEPC